MKGLAVAPPAIMFIMGVSTSMNSLSSKNERMNWIILLLVMKVSLLLALTMRSR